jgi:crossover junction endodeoxyribonuclease RuvC
MRLIGIDPGLRRTGFGVVEIVSRQKAVYLGSGVIRPPTDRPEPERLGLLYAGMQSVLAQYAPTAAVIEQVFVNVNPRSTLSLGQARGVAIAALAAASLPVSELTPLKIKQSIVGTGRASKEQVAHMVCRLLGLSQPPSADAADALACALAFWHAQRP